MGDSYSTRGLYTRPNVLGALNVEGVIPENENSGKLSAEYSSRAASAVDKGGGKRRRVEKGISPCWTGQKTIMKKFRQVKKGGLDTLPDEKNLKGKLNKR